MSSTLLAPGSVTAPVGRESFALAGLDAFLSRVEKEIRLIERVRPRRCPADLQRVKASFLRGKPSSPAHPPLRPVNFGQLRRLLLSAADRLDGAGRWGRLYAERARELDLEAGIAENLGSPAAVQYAAQRFPVEMGQAGRQVQVWASAWLEPAPPCGEARFRSDDQSRAESLVRQLQAELRRQDLRVRIALEPDLQSKAAVGDGVIYLRPDLWLSEREARRLVVHEVDGHVVPRENARRGGMGILRVGTRRAADDEEGRALLLERRAGLLDAERRFELALRHQAALMARAGADFVEVAQASIALGASLDSALGLAERTLRGGGLGRELVYLPSLYRVERAFHSLPDLEHWFRMGRVSVEAARELAQLGPAPESLAA